MSSFGNRIFVPLVLAGMLAAQDDAVAIGSRGVRLTLADGWKSKVLDQDLGGHQFSCVRGGLFGGSDQVFFVVREVPGLLENERDYRAVHDEMMAIGGDVPLEITRAGDVTRIHRTVDDDSTGIKVTFRTELTVRDGIGLHVMAWSTRSQKKALDRRFDEYREGLRFPGDDSDWRRELEPVAHRAIAPGLAIEVQAPPAWWQRKPAQFEDELLRLETGDEAQSFVVFQIQANGSWALARHELETLQDWDPTTREHARVEFERGGLSCMRLITVGDVHCTHTVLMPAGGDQWLMCRFSAPGSVTDARPSREALLASLRPLREAEIDVLDLPKPASAAAATPDDRLWHLIDEATVRRVPDVGYLKGLEVLPDGALVLRSWQSVQVLREGAPPEMLVRSQCDSVTQYDGAWLATTDNELRAVVAEGLAETARGNAAVAVADGAGLLLTRVDQSKTLGRYGGWWAAEREQQLVRRAANGEERVLCDLPVWRVQQLALDATAARVLVVGSRQDGARGFAPTLLQVPLGAPRPMQLGRWDAIANVVPVVGGVLVAGRPRGRPSGLWLLRGDGSDDDLQALVTGDDLFALDADAEAVRFAAREPSGTLRICRLTRQQCAERGALCQPFSASNLLAIAAEVFADSASLAVPDDPEAIGRLQQRIDAVATRVAGAPLPATPDGFVALCSELMDQSPDGRTRLVLTVRLCQLLLDRGAEWVPAGCPVDVLTWTTRRQLLPDTLFARPYHPAHMLSALLDPSEDDYIDLDDVLAPTPPGGRLLLGLDPQTLAKHAEELTPAGFDAALASGDVGVLSAIVRNADRNAQLRDRVYDALLEAGQHEATLSLARERLKAPTPSHVDLAALAAARAARATDDAAARSAVGEILRSIAVAGDDTRVYLLLGELCERAFPSDKDKARQCFRRVLEQQQYGPIAERAKAGEARLLK
ncbi:MAG: hypothetical protein R3F29_06290 [Planctomycetota bacterium]